METVIAFTAIAVALLIGLGALTGDLAIAVRVAEDLHHASCVLDDSDAFLRGRLETTGCHFSAWCIAGLARLWHWMQ